MRLGSNNQTVEVEVVLGRRLIGTFMTIYMPTILLNIIGHSTNYFKPFFFEAIVTVNLTVSSTNKSLSNLYNIFVEVMLVLTTMFVGVSQTLPKTSSIKMVDYWLVFNLLIPFVEVLIHTYEVNRYITATQYEKTFSILLQDTLRIDEQEINHHGKSVTVGADSKSVPSLPNPEVNISQNLFAVSFHQFYCRMRY